MKATTRYLVFLDIDGVFTSARVHYAHGAEYNMWHRFDPVAVDFLNKLHDSYPVEFVLISTWKDGLMVDHMMTQHWMASAFANSGFRGSFADQWKTDPDNVGLAKPRPYNRAHEIRDYLSTYGTQIQDYFILDDQDYGFDAVLGKKRWVRTDTDEGLLYRHMKNAMSLVGQWQKK